MGPIEDKHARPDLSTDRAWLDGFRRGDSTALERVFRTYAPYAIAVLRRGGGGSGFFAPGIMDKSEQDDLLQEVFVRVLSPSMRSQYDGIRPFSSFLGGVVRHVLIDYSRRRARLRDRMADDANLDASFDGWVPSVPLPEAELLSREENALVAEFVGSLDAHEAAFVRLRFETGLSQRDTATELGLSRQSVRTMESKIRSRFAKFLTGRGFLD